MSYTNDLTNLANIASVVTRGITSNGTVITKISVGNNTVNATVNSTGVYVNGSAVYQTTADAALYLPLVGGTLTGTVNVGSSVSLSTTALNIGNSTVNTAANSIGFYVNGSVIGSWASRILTTDSLLLSTDGIVQANNSLTLTLMAASTVIGKQFYVININTSNVNIIGNTSSETINGYANIVIQFKNSSLGLVSTGSSWIIN